MLGAKRAMVYPVNISWSPSGVNEPLGLIQSSAGKIFVEYGRSGWRGIAAGGRVLRQRGRTDKQYGWENAEQHVHGVGIPTTNQPG